MSDPTAAIKSSNASDMPPTQEIQTPRGVLHVFRHSAFALLWSGAFISNIGNWMENAAQQWAVVSQTPDPHRQAFLAEILNFSDFAPALALALIAGVISDRLNRRTWLLILQGLACVLGSLLAVAAFRGYASPWVVIAFTFAEGIVWALNGPAWLTIVPSLVPRNELERAIALNSVQFNLARVLGPILGTLAIALAGVKLAFAINACTFFLVIYALFQIPDQPVKRSTSKRPPLMKDLGAGLKFVWGHPGTRRLAFMGASFMILAAPLQGLMAVFAHQILPGKPNFYGFMAMAFGLGTVGSALMMGRIPSYYPRHHLIPLSMTAFCLAALGYSFSSNAVLTLALLLFCGMFWLLSMNPTNTANQLLASDDNRSRVMSVMLLCNQGGMTLGHLLASGLTRFMGPKMVVRVMVGLLLLITTCFLLKREPAIDNLPRNAAGKLSFLQHLREAITAASHRPGERREESHHHVD